MLSSRLYQSKLAIAKNSTLPIRCAKPHITLPCSLNSSKAYETYTNSFQHKSPNRPATETPKLQNANIAHLIDTTHTPHKKPTHIILIIILQVNHQIAHRDKSQLHRLSK